MTGAYSTRSPRRSELIAAVVIEVLRVEGMAIEFLGVDVLDGTPVMDLKAQKD